MRIGVDIGGTNLVAGLVDNEFNIMCKESTPTLAGRSADEVIDDIIMLCKKLMESNNLLEKDIDSIGIGVPGAVDPVEGIVLECTNVKLGDMPLKTIIQQHINVPVYLGNDADCAALGEAYGGATKDVNHSVMVTIGTGIGGGIIINKKIYSGFNGMGGEIGHMVIEKGGELCGCGRKGCWEAYGSATALVRMTNKAIKENPESLLAKSVERDTTRTNGKTAFDAMRQGCPVGKLVVDKYIEYFSTGIINMINIFQPEMVVIGGGVSKEGKPFVDAIMKYVNKEQYGNQTNVDKTIVCTAVLGNDAGVVGAAALGLN